MQKSPTGNADRKTTIESDECSPCNGTDDLRTDTPVTTEVTQHKSAGASFWQSRHKFSSPHQRMAIVLVVLLLASIAGNLFLFLSSQNSRLALEDDLEKQKETTVSLMEQLDSAKASTDFWDWIVGEYLALQEGDPDKDANAIISSVMAFQVEQIIAGLATEQERAIAISEWVSSNISNAATKLYGEGKIFENTPEAWFANRNGLCGARSVIAVRMMEIAGLNAHTLHMYNFPSRTGGHVCIEVFYEGQWHFFDVTYGGYFVRDGLILSFAQMVENPQAALDGMVVFKNTLDTDSWLTPHQNASNNAMRMESTYNLNSLTEYHSFAPGGKENIAVIDLPLSLESLPVTIGTNNQTDSDLSDYGSSNDFSIFTPYALALPGNDSNIQTKWEFSNCTPEARYVIEYHIYNASEAAIPYYAETTGATILQGATYSTTQAAANGRPEVWRIVFTPAAEDCSVRIAYDFTDVAVGAWIDSIIISNA